ncbi:hypothetical protein AaE_003765 [Aphanomyces astaci]|uniref:t-SNARE coiled-coil homology domain-containing protein n=1 Tax=Aphanomyces astaci TaxID=112090 RepID=A0A6A5APN6_APHAT|nr:hypothetical protein AaE_003765 [Aphanomyces astaci]
MFNDPTSQINELTQLVKQDITLIHTKLDDLEMFQRSHHADYSSQHAAKHSDAIVTQMKSTLMSTTKGFKDILQVRQDNLQHQHDRKSQYGRATPRYLTYLRTYLPTYLSTYVPFQNHVGFHIPTFYYAVAPLYHANLPVRSVPLAFSAPLPRPVGVEGEGGGSEHVPLISAQSQQQFVVPEQGYADSRAEAVSNIQSHIVELGELFQRLSVMISAQGDSVRMYDRCMHAPMTIDENVDDAVVNVHQGTRQLEMFRDSLSNSALMMKVGGILVVFVVLFLFFMA